MNKADSLAGNSAKQVHALLSSRNVSVHPFVCRIFKDLYFKGLDWLDGITDSVNVNLTVDVWELVEIE